MNVYLFFSKQKQTNEEDTIYDVNDSKSMGSNVYNDDYTNGSSMIGCKGAGSRDDAEDTTSSSKTKCTPPATKRSGFNEHLKRMYSNINKTLTVSTQLLSKANLNPISLIKQLDTSANTNTKLNNEKSSAEPSPDSTTTTTIPTVKAYNINEYNANYVDLKCEKDVAIDRLKLYNKPDTSTPVKKTNIERELEKRKKDYFDRIENQYVSGPALMDNSTSSNSNNNDRLEIYEVDFDNNIAYIIPSKETSLRESHTTTSIIGADQTAETEHDVTIAEDDDDDDEDAEIYQSINEADLDHKTYDDCHSLINGAGNENVDKSSKLKVASKVNMTSDEIIYSAPTNKLIGEEHDDHRRSTPVIRLMNHENNETHA